jgi:CubicO group peptidase (beta-lactamase class C family)
MPDGGMISTATDLVRLVTALVDGDLLARDTALAMRTPQGPASTEPQQYGYGLILGVEDGRVRTVGHGGGDPGVSALLTHDLPTRTTVVTLCNQDRGSFAASKRLAEAFGTGEPRG